jgi:hypothetical protein
MELKQALQEFWAWAQLTPSEYEEGVSPRNPDIYWGSEWEDSYADFDRIDHAFRDALININESNMCETMKLLLEAISIDNEREYFADIVIEYMDERMISCLFNASIKYRISGAQWQLASRVLKSNSNNKYHHLTMFLENGANEYVKKRALLSIQSLGLGLNK